MSKVRLKVREIAESQGWNMSQLSRKTDIAFNTIRRLWKNPYESVNLQTLSKIAQFLGVPVNDLIEEVPNDTDSENHNS